MRHPVGGIEVSRSSKTLQIVVISVHHSSEVQVLGFIGSAPRVQNSINQRNIAVQVAFEEAICLATPGFFEWRSPRVLFG
jgi:hypothetical protein